MPNESTPDENLTRGARDFGDMERDALYLLTDPQHYPTLWSIPDVGREMEYFDPEALILPLHRAGLIYRMGEFVFATPAAFHLVSLVGQAV
jgi:hypothetical protein